MRQGVMRNFHTYPILPRLIFFYIIRTRMRINLYKCDKSWERGNPSPITLLSSLRLTI